LAVYVSQAPFFSDAGSNPRPAIFSLFSFLYFFTNITCNPRAKGLKTTPGMWCQAGKFQACKDEYAA
jgi:hypothetical protein